MSDSLSERLYEGLDRRLAPLLQKSDIMVGTVYVLFADETKEGDDWRTIAETRIGEGGQIEWRYTSIAGVTSSNWESYGPITRYLISRPDQVEPNYFSLAL